MQTNAWGIDTEDGCTVQVFPARDMNDVGIPPARAIMTWRISQEGDWRFAQIRFTPEELTSLIDGLTTVRDQIAAVDG